MNIAIILLIIILVLAGFITIIFTPSINLRIMLFLIKPLKPYIKHKIPIKPDYHNYDYWAAFPQIKNIADLVPVQSTLKSQQENAAVDVFYIHRTTLLSNRRWNADIGNIRLNIRTDIEAVRNQVSIFNESCKIYAPRYRQATLYSFFDKSGSGQRALDLAYQDIKDAFRYYLDHYNQGRPIVIAGHSQGAEHAQRLLKEYFDGKELCKKLVVAYLIGMPIHERTFTEIPPGGSPSQTGCFLCWSTFGWGISPNYFQESYRTSVCTNPLTWDKNEAYGGFQNHLGSVPLNFRRIDKQIIDATCAKGVIWIHNRKKYSYMALPVKNYVVMDLNLFYMNIRENLKLRINNYLNTGN
jgi:pimeloyl-ACP methyl ester carboxylesterase